MGANPPRGYPELSELAAPVPDLASTLLATNSREPVGAGDSGPYDPYLDRSSRDDALHLQLQRMEQRTRDTERRNPNPRRTLSGSRPRVRLPSSEDYRFMSYHGVAPAAPEEEYARERSPSREYQRLLQDEPGQMPDTATRRHHREQEQRELDLLRTSRETSLERMRQRYNQYVGDRSREREYHPSPDTSLRSAALLGSARRHVRLSHLLDNPSSDPRTERERYYESEMDWRRHTTQEHRRSTPSYSNLRSEMMSNLHRARRGDGENSSASRWLEEAIKYLERLRSCQSHSDRLMSAQESGFMLDNGSLFASSIQDFVLDTTQMQSPPPSTWLRPGSVFSGYQHANATPSPTHRPAPDGPPLPNYPRQPRGPPGRASAGSWITNVLMNGSGRTGASTSAAIDGNGSYTGCNHADERWPVKVTINSVDPERMTLTGTMEAFEVPNKTQSGNGNGNGTAHEASITTHLEGEIIDFKRHTLETINFNADAGIDSTYWRKLEPFRSMGDSEVVSSLVSQKWHTDQLNQNWILMRWKGTLKPRPHARRGTDDLFLAEKCFVTPSDAQLEVTISGFYYCSLRRDTGLVEGLYYDPLSSPYQRLKLKPEKPMFPAYKFT